jgi:hypothetical protein
VAGRRSGQRPAASVTQRDSRSWGTLPPFSASFFITSLCSHMFIVAVSFVSPR